MAFLYASDTSPETLLFNLSSIIPKRHRNFNEFRVPDYPFWHNICRKPP